MSGAHDSDGRNSQSSDLSITSSPTLNSRYEGNYEGNGEGSSSHTPAQARSRDHSRGGSRSRDVPSRNSESPLSADRIHEHDFAHRRHRSGNSGAFLLDSTFASGPKARQQTRHSGHVEDGKGKRSSRHSHHFDDMGSHDGLRSHLSPLSREVKADQSAARDDHRVDAAEVQDQDGKLQVPKTRASIRIAAPPVRAPSPIHNDEPPRSTIDPNQIVHMALNLSASRQRNLTAGQLIAPQPTGSQRAASMALTHDTGGSLRQYLNDQRRVSRNISPFGGRRSSQHMPAALPRSMSMSVQGQLLNPSPGTLARRDKALAYIELKMEYLRLLDLLPPLKPDATAPGNYIFSSNNVPGSPQAYLTRIQSYAGKKHELGRAYNPLQLIRNRRLRAREEKPLYHVPEEFKDVEEVRDWVDRVEQASQYSDFRRDDGVRLPTYHDEHKTENSKAKSSSSHLSWNFSPEELIADALWLEQDDNKVLIENRHSRKIFPPRETYKNDFLDSGRSSKEYSDKRRRSWVEGLTTKPSEPGTEDDSEAPSDRGRKKRILPNFRAESPKQKRHRLRGAGYSSGSDSESDTSKWRSGRSRKLLDPNENTGPLGLHLKEIMERDAQTAKMDSANLGSPDTPDKWGPGLTDGLESTASRSSMEAGGFSNGSLKGVLVSEGRMPPRQRTDLTLASESVAEPRSSYESRDGSGTESTFRKKHFPHIGSDLSPPPSRDGSIKKKSRLDIFRSDDHAKGHKRNKSRNDTDLADKQGGSRQTSGETQDGGGIGTAILGAPSAVKSLLTHRKNDSVSSLNKPDQKKDVKDTKDFAEPPSAVTRFLKGVRNEGTRVGDIIFRKDRPAEDSDSEGSDVDVSLPGSDIEGKPLRRARPVYKRSGTADTATTAGSIATRKNGYHLELPTFRSHMPPEQDPASDLSIDDHVTRQARARARNRSPRFDRLAPQKLDLGHISSNSTPGTSRSHSPAAERERMKRVLARPGGVGLGGLPVTSLAHVQHASPSPSTTSVTSSSNLDPYENRSRSTSSRPPLEKRHWSITDSQSNVPRPHHSSHSHTQHSTLLPPNTIITSQDLARIRALFLCSGIKAQVIAQRALSTRPAHQTPQFLLRAAESSNQSIYPVRRKEEHVLAAHFLTTHLDSEFSALESSTSHFRDETVKDLAERLAALKARVESELFPRVRESGDEALRITSQVSGNAPLGVKQVVDEIENMVRMRRRRMRWLRRVGWQVVEWLLLGCMWCAWLVVVVLGIGRRVVGAVVRVGRWLLWV